MIISITHKGLKMYYEEGRGTKLPAAQLSRIRRILSMLDAVTSEQDIKHLGHGVHALKGDYTGYWALSVTGNYCIVFRFDSGDIYDIDYLDYH